jgi:hypothetical protein
MHIDSFDDFPRQGDAGALNAAGARESPVDLKVGEQIALGIPD